MQEKDRKGSSLRILLFVESAATGVGRHVIDLARELNQHKHHVHVIHSLTNIDSRFSAGAQALADAGCQVVGRKMRHGGHPSDVELIVWLRRYIRQKGPFDVIHCHSTKAGLVGRLATIGTGSRIFYTPNAFMTMKPGLPAPVRWALAAMESSLARLSHRVIAVSEQENSHGREIGIPSDRLATVPNGTTIIRTESIDVIRQRVRKLHRIPPDAIGIGFVGRLNHQKAPDHLLSAFAALKEKLNQNIWGQIRLLIVGDGPLRKSLQAQCVQLGLGDCVHWLGEQDGEETVCAFDIFALSSDYEGLPYVILEAMSAGNPIVTTDVGGMRELIVPGVNGYVLPRRDVNAFATALAELATDDQLRRRMSVASSDRVKRFSARQMADDTLNLYFS